MFTLDDIKPLVLKDGATAILIKERAGQGLDPEMKKTVSAQLKKATKLPVVFIPDNVNVEVQYSG